MLFDLKEIPFSVRGSYMAVSWLDETFHAECEKEGLYLRTIHGGVGDPCIARIQVMKNGEPCAFEIQAEPEKVTLSAENGKVFMTYADEDTLLVAGDGEKIGVCLDFMPKGDFNFIQPVRSGEECWYLANCFKGSVRYMLYNQEGTVNLQQNWNVSRADHCRFEADAEDGRFLLIMEEVKDSWKNRGKRYVAEKEWEARREEFVEFYKSMPSVPDEFSEAAEKAAYVDWVSMVKEHRLLTREAMLMSKNWMCNVWSWDHCFNALALAYHQPELAWDQFMLMFDYQTESGRIPDSVNDTIIIDNYCKPPIHGWTLRKLRSIMQPDAKKLQEAYEKIGKWTLWWLNYRDQDHDSLCEYTHGNDSGWDNATAFQMLPPVTLPDLAAFLILQMDELSEVAGILGKQEEAAEWKKRAEAMQEKMLERLFKDGRPRALQSLTGEEIPTESLILYLPIVLGKKLPEDVRGYLISRLESEAFCTEYGFATESPQSRQYESDGYWRGPIWAPSTMLLADGLWESGEKEFVKKITHKFCSLIAKSGCAENFDALTGEGLRDRAYTWTASVMLVMAHEYL